jgi:hypothetical protein
LTDWRGAYNRLAAQAAELRQQRDEKDALLAGHSEAIELWDALELGENDQVTGSVLIVKVADFAKGTVNIASSAGDGTDWIDQLGLFEAWRTMNFQTPILGNDDES